MWRATLLLPPPSPYRWGQAKTLLARLAEARRISNSSTLAPLRVAAAVLQERPRASADAATHVSPEHVDDDSESLSSSGEDGGDSPGRRHGFRLDLIFNGLISRTVEVRG